MKADDDDGDDDDGACEHSAPQLQLQLQLAVELELEAASSSGRALILSERASESIHLPSNLRLADSNRVRSPSSRYRQHHLQSRARSLRKARIVQGGGGAGAHWSTHCSIASRKPAN